MAVQCDPHSYSRPPNWLERTFLYTFGGYWPIRGLASYYWPIRNLHSYYWLMTGLSGLVILLHTSSLYMSSSGSQQFIILAPPRYYYYPTKLVINMSFYKHSTIYVLRSLNVIQFQLLLMYSSSLNVWLVIRNIPPIIDHHHQHALSFYNRIVDFIKVTCIVVAWRDS